MTMWADNIKFVKDIIDSKYQKIDAAAAEVRKNKIYQTKNQTSLQLDDWECWSPTEGPILWQV